MVDSLAAAPLAVHGLASRLELTLNGPRVPELRAALTSAWSRCLVATPLTQTPAEPVSVWLTSPGDRLGTEPDNVRSDDLATALQETTQAVTRSFIAAQAGRLFMLHGGACADRDTGATVAFVAPGGTGKTTLTRLLGRDLGYLTDETVGITRDGLVVGYPKPLSLRPSAGAGPKRETSPDELGLQRAPSRSWLRRIVLLQRPGDFTGAPELTALPLPDAIMALAPETSSLSSLERPLQLMASLIEQTGPVLRCRYREAADLAPLLIELVRS